MSLLTDLRRTRVIYRRHGGAKATFEDEDGRCCISFAVGLVIAGLDADRDDILRAGGAPNPRAMAVMRALQKAQPHGWKQLSPITYQDAADTTKADVLAVLNRAIEKAAAA